MKHSTLLALTVGIAAACSLFAPAKASAFGLEDRTKWGRHHTGVFDNDPRMQQIKAANAVLDGTAKPAGRLTRRTPAAEQTAETKPAFEFKDLDYFGDLDGPDGKLWYYTAHFDYERVEPHDNVVYVDFIMKRFRFDIYDADMKFVGSVSDAVTYKEDEVRVRQADLAPVVTRNFFNTDDKYEIIVGLVYNTTYYVNRQYTKIYSMDGKKDQHGNDVCLMVSNEPVVDVLDASTPEKENFYISVMTEGTDYVSSGNEEDDMESHYWEMYLGYYNEIKTYAPAVDGNGPRLVNTYKVKLSQLPGDMQDDPIMMTYVRDGVPYFMTQYYEQPFYNQYNSYLEDMTQREGNNLVVDIYKVADTGFEKVQTTKIAAPKNVEDERVAASYYAVGALRYYGDIIENGGEARDFLVTRKDFITAKDGYDKSYFRYNSKGEKTNTIFNIADSFISLSDIPGQAPQMMFVNYISAYNEYEFHFVNMDTYETEMKMSYLVDMEDGDPERLTANMDRVAVGDSYMYAIELRVPSTDEFDNNHMRVMWLDKKGNVDHIEEINMGKNVNYALTYMSASTLDPHYFNSDDNREYMMLIKRAAEGGTSREEMLIGQAITADTPDGKDLLLLGPDAELGAMANIVPYDNYLMVSYKNSVNDKEVLAARYYLLPLDKTVGINDVNGPANGNGFELKGNTIVANGTVEVFDMSGARVAGAANSLSLDGLRSGIYVVRAGGKAAKLVVR